MSVVDPAAEPPNAEFVHQRSGRRYVVERRDGQLWHKESLLPVSGVDSQPDPLADIQVEYPMRYLVGSGRHSRTYLAEIDGFLIESPVTWYSSTQKWSMSPGFEGSNQVGFERAADEGCLICHVGQVASINGAQNRLTINEPAIGCERCHGPGKMHVKYQQARTERMPGRNTDDSIVHPGRLSRGQHESICAQCHLRGDATVFRRGLSFSDFQPGMSLADVRIDYRLESDDGSMKVVGHVDQMHASRCYQNSDSLNCTTCHEMHSNADPKLSQAFFRSKCLDCHSTKSCGLNPAKRQTESPDDNCVQCHMPQVETDIPHIAFTHHRIGIHGQNTTPAKPEATAGQLIPFEATADLTGLAAQRCLGLAYAEFAARQSDGTLAAEYRRRAIQLLESVANTAEADGEVYSVLARFAWEDRNQADTIAYASRAMSSEGLSAGAHVNCLLVMGDTYLQLGQSANAAKQLDQLVTLRRNSHDWLLLGIARFQARQREAGLTAVQQAIEIQPFQTDYHQTLADMLREAGKSAEADSCLRLANRLRAYYASPR